MYKNDFALDGHQGLICHKNYQPINQNIINALKIGSNPRPSFISKT